MKRLSEDEVWYWYNKIEEQKNSGMMLITFCEKYNLNEVKFTNMKHRISYKRDSDPEGYEKLRALTKLWKSSGLRASKFAHEHNINVRYLGQMTTHLNYVAIIEKFKAQQEEKPMHFIEVKATPLSTGESPITQAPISELIEKQNDIEMIITKGVKVTISPNIDSMKIIKIIELLKDL